LGILWKRNSNQAHSRSPDRIKASGYKYQEYISKKYNSMDHAGQERRPFVAKAYTAYEKR
jgi:hypothetical protein